VQEQDGDKVLILFEDYTGRDSVLPFHGTNGISILSFISISQNTRRVLRSFRTGVNTVGLE
jgi:hypothetical protein